MKTDDRLYFLQACVFLSIFIVFGKYFIPLHEFLCVCFMNEGLLNITGFCKLKVSSMLSKFHDQSILEVF